MIPIVQHLHVPSFAILEQEKLLAYLDIMSK